MERRGSSATLHFQLFVFGFQLFLRRAGHLTIQGERIRHVENAVAVDIGKYLLCVGQRHMPRRRTIKLESVRHIQHAAAIEVTQFAMIMEK